MFFMKQLRFAKPPPSFATPSEFSTQSQKQSCPPVQVAALARSGAREAIDSITNAIDDSNIVARMISPPDTLETLRTVRIHPPSSDAPTLRRWAALGAPAQCGSRSSYQPRAEMVKHRSPLLTTRSAQRYADRRGPRTTAASRSMVANGTRLSQRTSVRSECNRCRPMKRRSTGRPLAGPAACAPP